MAPTPEWIEVSKAFATGIGVALPLIGTMAYFHKERSNRFTQIEQKTSKFDTDLSGLIKQLGAIINDVEQRFLPRREHDAAIQRLDGNIIELTRNIGRLNDHLIELARRRDDSHHRG